LIVAPDLHYPKAAIQDLSADVWSDALSSKVLSTINVTQAFLPLVRRCQSRIVIATPNVLGSLCLPYSAIENVSVQALEAFIKTLRRETEPYNVPITHIKLGCFDFGVSRLVLAEPDQLMKFKPSLPWELHATVFDALTRNTSTTIRVGRGSVAYDLAGRLLPSSLVDWMIGSRVLPTQEISRSRSIEGWESVVGENN
jgi:NAD(P)-dependent dehydrogenase (short-subunit alcohol dehydrogenase family)